MGIFSSSFIKMTSDRVDCAIQHSGLSLVEKERFCYFVNNDGNWTGDVLPVSVMDEYGIKDWIELAENIVERMKKSKYNSYNANVPTL